MVTICKFNPGGQWDLPFINQHYLNSSLGPADLFLHVCSRRPEAVLAVLGAAGPAVPVGLRDGVPREGRKDGRRTDGQGHGGPRALPQSPTGAAGRWRCAPAEPRPARGLPGRDKPTGRDEPGGINRDIGETFPARGGTATSWPGKLCVHPLHCSRPAWMGSGQPEFKPSAVDLNEVILPTQTSLIPWSRLFFINIFYTLAADADAHPSD